MKKRKSSGNRVAIYARYSSDNQRDESIDAQIRYISEYCENNDYTIVKVYTDRAKSATSDKRPAFQEMIRDSALDIFDVVVVHKLDRFSRDRYDSVVYKRKLKKNGIRLLSVTENFNDSPESVILESVLEGMAEYYSKNLAREVMKGMTENALKCMHTGGTPPLGYDVDPVSKKYIINEQEALVVRDIFRLYNDGYGYGKIINALNAKGYKTKKDRPFGKNSLHEIIANEKYSGVYIFNRSSSKDSLNGTRNNHEAKDDDNVIRIEDGVPAIVSKEEWTKARSHMETNRRRPGSYNAKEIYLLSGLVVCGECGHAMTGNMRYSGRNKSKYVSYKCCYRENNKACVNKEIRREYLEGFVLSELERLIFNDATIPKLVSKLNAYQAKKATRSGKDSEVIRARLNDINSQMNNIVGAIATGFTQPEFKQKMTELDEQKASCELQLAELSIPEKQPVITEDTLRKIISMFREYITTKNIPECKKFIQSFVDKVVVFQDHVEVVLKVTVTPGQGDGLTFTSEEGVKEIREMFKVA